jgi:acyl-homoserine lactone acylase PvdQ
MSFRFITTSNFRCRRLRLPVFLFVAVCAIQAATNPLDITIVRDDWGIAHVYGKTDADAFFGAVYAQAEDETRPSAMQRAICAKYIFIAPN